MFLTLNETIEQIKSGKLLHIAADDSLLSKLPTGKWIAGTTPYFIDEAGGILSKDKLFVDDFSIASDYRICIYDAKTISTITNDAYDNGITFLLIPFGSEVAATYAHESQTMDDLLMFPTIGWIAGFDLSTDGIAKCYNGGNAIGYSDKAVALHLRLPQEKIASLGIVNIFHPDENGDVIEFAKDTFDVTTCLVNGKEVYFSDYLKEKKINTQMPLIADYNGVSFNVSIKAIDEAAKKVAFYAAVFSGEKYRFAQNVDDYEAAFSREIAKLDISKPLFSCNCILNYLYGKLEGKSTAPFAGPVTFGEVAYQLLNQTLVYITVLDK